ncbi:hypothetical protein ABQE58_25130 [Mycolicibacterium elephantis]
MTSVRLVLMKGAALTLYAVVGKDGVCDVHRWLEDLATQPQVQFQARFERLCEVGHLRSPDEMHPLECPGAPKVHVIKVRSGFRLYAVREGTDWVATHGKKKPKDKHVCREADKARELFVDYQERCKR